VESALMGYVIFGTYDFIIKTFETNNHLHKTSEVPIVIHTGAGMASGISRSVFWMGWEKFIHQSNWIQEHPKFCVRTTIHNSIGYGTLFGSYSSIRQFLVFADPFSIIWRHDHTNNKTSLVDSNDPDKNQNRKDADCFGILESIPQEIIKAGSDEFIPITYTFISGGIAGQIHHIVNHYTSHWKQFRSSQTRQTLPRLYPQLSSFGTMALCFAAFEHGPEIADRIVNKINKSLL
jgi:hypothetical protein